MSSKTVDFNYEKLLRNYPKSNKTDDDSDIDISPTTPLVISENKPKDS
jgi:hypothetical protein